VPKPKRLPRKAIWLFAEIAVVVSAVALRVAALLSMAGSPRARWPQVDAWTYFDQARQLALGKDPFADGFYQPPGYPAFLSVLFKAFEASPDVARTANAALGVFTVVALVFIGRRLGTALGAPWAGAAAGALYTLYPRTLLIELDLLTPALTNALLVGTVALLFINRLPMWLRCALVGLGGAWACEVYATALLFLPALAWVLWRMGARLTRGGLAFAIAVLIGIWPTWGRNLQQWDSWAPISHNSGLNFYLGNNPNWKDTTFLRPGLPFRDLALEAEPHRRDLRARNRYWTKRTWREIRGAPGQWLGALAEKAHWSVHQREIPRNEDYRCWTEAGSLLWIRRLPARYGILLPIALIGALALCTRRRSTDAGPDRPSATAAVIPLAWLCLHLPMVMFFVSDRYRLATWPWLCLCAAFAPLGWRKLRAAWSSDRRPWSAMIALGLGCTLPWLPIDSVTSPDPGWCRHLEGNYAISDKRWEQAEALYREALVLNPNDIGAYPWLSAVLDRQGRLDEALEAQNVALNAFPTSYPTLKTMAVLARKAGDLDQAIAYTARAMQVPGDRSTMATRYVTLLVEAKRYAQAQAFIDKYPKLARHKRLKNAIETLEALPD
jgi:tetratricopeptide (TPR) repeat protein